MNLQMSYWQCPYLYIIYAADLKPLHSSKFLVKFADDTTLIVAEHSAVGK